MKLKNTVMWKQEQQSLSVKKQINNDFSVIFLALSVLIEKIQAAKMLRWRVWPACPVGCLTSPMTARTRRPLQMFDKKKKK